VVTFRKASDPIELPPPDYTGIKTFKFTGYSRAPTLTVGQQAALRARLLGIKLEVNA
jgi:hypothetical protein